MNNQPIAWSVADPSLATIDQSGNVTPVHVGYTTVRATSGALSATSLLSIRGPVAIPTRSNYNGMNLGGIAYYSTEFPFADMVKSGMGWTSREDNGTWGRAFPATTADGYPASLYPGQHAFNAVAWIGGFSPGQYVILWDGDGSLSTPLSNVTVVSNVPHRMVINVTDTSGQLWVSIDATSPQNPVHNVRFLWPGTEPTYANQPFNPVFLSKLAPFSLMRYMDWGQTNGSPVVNWADRAQVGDVTYASRGVPLEVMIDLANTLHVDPWFCVPHMATDDYVTQFATLLHDRLDPGLHPHIEYSNEVWNTGFSQTTWANQQSQTYGYASPYGQPAIFYAVRSVQIFKIIQNVYGSTDSGRLVRVLAGQAAWDNFLTNMLAYRDTAANADVLAIAPYFGTTSASTSSTPDQLIDQMLANMRGDVKTWMTHNAALAAQYHLTMKAYESGPGDTTYQFPSNQQDQMTALFIAANRNARMHDVMTEYYGQWAAAGGNTMNQFNDIGSWSKYGFWATLEYVTEGASSSPRYQGLLDFIAQHPTPP